eukprot:5330295-Alexandrium_andersonii.AAC.1
MGRTYGIGSGVTHAGSRRSCVVASYNGGRANGSPNIGLGQDIALVHVIRTCCSCYCIKTSCGSAQSRL